MLRISGFVIMSCYEEDNPAAKSLAKVCDEVLIVTIDEQNKFQLKDNIKYASYEFRGSFSDVKNYALSLLSGDYIIYLNPYEELCFSNIKDKINEDKDGYYLNIRRKSREGSLIERQIRIVKRGIKYTNKFMVVPDIKTYGFINEEIKSRYYDNPSTEMQMIDSMLKKILQNGSEDFDTKYAAAKLFYMKGDYESSCISFEKALSIYQEEPDEIFFRDMALSYLYLGLNIESISILHRGIEKNDEYGELYYYLGLGYKNIGNYEKALNNLVKARECRDDLMLTYTEGYKSYKNYFHEGEIYRELQDYLKAAKSFTEAVRGNPDYTSCAVLAAKCLRDEGFDKHEIERYLRDNFNISGKEFVLLMAIVCKELKLWDEALKYSEILSDYESKEITILSLYHINEYKRCFNEINENYKSLNKKLYGILALCCIIMENKINPNAVADFIGKYKRDGYGDIVNAYNFFAYDLKYVGDKAVIQQFCITLLESSNGRCIKYIRSALENIKDLDYYELAVSAYKARLYYFSEEIINLYCREFRYDYKILLLLCSINYETGNIKECEKNISYALTIDDSIELKKLYCLCKLYECKNIIRNKMKQNEKLLFYKALENIETAEKILSGIGTNSFL